MKKSRTNLVGKKVRLKLGESTRPGPRKIAKITREYIDIPNGVIVDPSLDGFKSWNLDALEFVE